MFSIDTYSPLGLVQWLIVYAAIPLLTLYFYLLLKERLEREPPTDWPGHESWGVPEREAQLAYLGAYRSALRMPDGLAEELVLKTRDRIDESREALIAEGMAPEAATAEAISRMGPASDLAKGARRSNQTMLKFAGGIAAAILALPGASVLGSLPGLLTKAVTLLIGSMVFSVSHQSLNSIADDQLRTTAGMLVLSAGAFYASRTAVRVFAGVSGRRPAPLGIGWAVVGTPIVGAYMLFMVRDRQSWPMFIAEMLVPIAFAAGALTFVGRSWWLEPIRSRAVVAFVGASIVIGLVSSLLLTSAYGSNYVNIDPYSPGQTQEAVQAIRAIDPASPYPSATDHFDGSFYSYPVLLSRGWSSDPVTLYLYFYGANMANPLPGWTDIRIEAWRGTNLGGIAQGESAPKATAPASPEVFPAIPGATNPEAENEVLTGTLALGMRRDGPFWWILVTGVAPDGVRYRLANNREANLTAGRPGLSDRVQLATITPYGTAWDWLTAPG